MKLLSGLIPLVLASLSLSNLSHAADTTFDALCEQGARQVASAWGTPAMDAHIADNFTGNAAQFALSEADAAYGLRLDVVSVKSIQKVAEDSCTAKVSVRFVHPQADHSVVEILPPVTGNWTLQLPSPVVPSSEPVRFNASEESAIEGVAMLRVHMGLPSGSRQTFLQEIAVRADRLSASKSDADSVLLPLQPASGWVVRVGDQETMTEKDGSFVLNAAQKGVTEGEILNPATRAVFQTFSLNDLAVVGGAKPNPIVVELQSHGGCGMDEDDPQHCGQ